MRLRKPAALAFVATVPSPAVLLATAAGFAITALTAGLQFTRAALRDERAHSAALLSWIEQHHPGTAYQPFDGDEAQR